MEQPFLLIHAVMTEDLNGLIRGHIALHDGDLCRYIFPHLCFDPVYQLLSFLKASGGFDKQAIGNRIFYR